MNVHKKKVEQEQVIEQQLIQSELLTLIDIIRHPQTDILQQSEMIFEFVTQKHVLCQNYFQEQEYKRCYLILKKVENLLQEIVRSLLIEDKGPRFPVKDIIIQMLDQGLIARKIDFESLIAEKPGIAICGLEHINVSFNFFLDTVVRHLIMSNNSISIIYILRGKFEEALIFILKAIRIRQVLLNSNLNFWQLGILLLNCSYICRKIKKIDCAEVLCKRAITDLERILKRISKDEWKQNDKNTENSQSFLLFLEVKDKTQLTSQQNHNSQISPRWRTLQVLLLAYKFYEELLTVDRRKNHDLIEDGIVRQFKIRQEIYKIQGQYDEELVPPKKKIKSINAGKLNFEDEELKQKFETDQNNSFDQNSFDSLNSQFPQKQKPIIIEENIIFQKVIKNQDKKKLQLIIFHLDQYNCIQIMLQSLEKDIIKCIYISYEQFTTFSSQYDPLIFQDQEKYIEHIFENLISRIIIKNNNIYISEFEYFHNLQDFLKFGTKESKI